MIPERVAPPAPSTGNARRRAAQGGRHAEREHEAEAQRLAIVDAALAAPLDMRSLGVLANGTLKGDLQTDHCLQESILRLRAAYLAGMGERLSRDWRTPATNQRFIYPGSEQTYRYCYDRQHAPDVLEERAGRGQMAQRRRKDVLLCANGMAAINVLLQSLAYLLEDRAARLIASASYFETHSLIRMSGFATRWTRVQSDEALLELASSSQCAVLLVEPVQYNWDLAISPWGELLEIWRCQGAAPIIIVDTTLSGETAAMDWLMTQLLSSPSPLVVRLRSGLKLDQEGLELANLGVLEWWAHPDVDLSLSKLRSVADAYRTVAGAGLGRDATWALSPQFVFEPSHFRAYSEGIFSNNRALFEAIELKGDLFEGKVYPPEPWDAPFLLMKLKEKGAEPYARLAALIDAEARRRGLRWTMSGSFGFRTERFETILPMEQIRTQEMPQGVLKIAAGRYQGARFEEVVELVNDLARFDTLNQAAAAFGRPLGGGR